MLVDAHVGILVDVHGCCWHMVDVGILVDVHVGIWLDTFHG